MFLQTYVSDSEHNKIARSNVILMSPEYTWANTLESKADNNVTEKPRETHGRITGEERRGRKKNKRRKKRARTREGSDFWLPVFKSSVNKRQSVTFVLSLVTALLFSICFHVFPSCLVDWSHDRCFIHLSVSYLTEINFCCNVKRNIQRQKNVQLLSYT